MLQVVRDPVNHPSHYNAHPSGVECIVITRHFNFNLGNVIKYLWRAAYKGHTLEDLKKARWYLDDEIGQMEAKERERLDAAKKLQDSGMVAAATLAPITRTGLEAIPMNSSETRVDENLSVRKTWGGV